MTQFRIVNPNTKAELIMTAKDELNYPNNEHTPSVSKSFSISNRLLLIEFN